MRTITLKRAKAIAADWHGGQWSALYAFASANSPERAQKLLCLREVEENLSNNKVGGRQLKRLQKLKAYLECVKPDYPVISEENLPKPKRCLPDAGLDIAPNLYL